MHLDVPSPIDLRSAEDARAWEASALAKRPCRTEFFHAFGRELASFSGRVLELGSGPGLLAAALLPNLPHVTQYVMLDFSEAMHALAQARISHFSRHVQFVQRSFLEADWTDGLGVFEAVVTNQAVHELRHKSRAPGLHAQVRSLLVPGGSYLVCDHFAGAGGMSNSELYMSVEEQFEALSCGGFSRIREVMRKGGMVLHHAS